MSDPRWVMDTTAYIHLCRAGHAEIIGKLAPTGEVVVPSDVSTEIEQSREWHADIPTVGSANWAELVVLGEEETWTALEVKAQMGGGPHQHLGECAVIAYARHHDMIAVLDDSAAVAQADRLGVATHGTMWIVVEAYKELLGREREPAVEIVDDLLATDMYLPVTSGASLFSWAYEDGLLP